MLQPEQEKWGTRWTWLSSRRGAAKRGGQGGRTVLQRRWGPRRYYRINERVCRGIKATTKGF